MQHIPNNVLHFTSNYYFKYGLIITLRDLVKVKNQPGMQQALLQSAEYLCMSQNVQQPDDCVYLCGVDAVWGGAGGAIACRTPICVGAGQKAMKRMGCCIHSKVDIIGHPQMGGVSKVILHPPKGLCPAAGRRRSCLRRSVGSR